MGWKNVKEHYRIGHYVQVTKQGICIGSAYIHDILVIDQEGRLIKSDPNCVNDDIRRYQREFNDDPAKLKELINAPDTFTNSITVYTYDGGDILEKKCEELGWPNVTHDGLMMYDNRFSASRAEVIEIAKSNAKAGIKLMRRRVTEARQELKRLKEELQKDRSALAKLNADSREVCNANESH